ncbi:DEAD/DEAH box helicase [Priestia megaterium]|uniref:DEAD/DEAH box helicase n=1 Tax=Priestia megaterium TaxID=1404 RepID=UPI003458C6F1
MNIELKEFQKESTAELLNRVARAKRNVREDEEMQAVLLSAPTGSGKTVMLAKLVEDILTGTEEFDEEQSATFLWISDQPELNIQSRNKIIEVSDRLHERHLEVITSDFNQEFFDSGKVYFLNTQKLGKDKNLTIKGDGREYTIWETIQNTGKKLKDKFYVIIDEAHRGMNSTKAELTTAKTIVQKFIIGSEEIDPVKIIIGISATSERFERLVNGTNRVLRSVNVDVNKVRESGLLKDRLVVYHPEDDQSADWSLLDAATRKWKKMSEEWIAYTRGQEIDDVNPVMVIQVEDGTGKQITRTDLETVLSTLESSVGTIQDSEIVHCFQEDKDIEIGSRKIRRMDASKINSDKNVKFVLFKMALTTGWDCPRAEVMMSFRRAQDSTLIAQLIGRMVRTPLARRVEGNEELNEVALYLPYYDETSLKTVIDKLKGDEDSVLTTEIQDGADLHTWVVPNSLMAEYEALNNLPSYRKGKKLTDLNRLMDFCNLLSVLHSINTEALPQSKKIIVDTLVQERDRLLASDAAFAEALKALNYITVKPVVIKNGEYSYTAVEPEKIEINENNVKDLFKRAKMRFKSEISLEYLRQNFDEDEPIKAKLELFLLSQKKTVWEKIELISKARIKELKEQYHTQLLSLPSSQREEYNKLWLAAREAEPEHTILPSKIKLPKGDVIVRCEKHLFSDDSEYFDAKLNEWEHEVIEEELKNENVAAWLRNMDRKNWALGIPYSKDAETEIMYPDFLIVRKTAGGFIVDILEPHNEGLSDNLEKAKGLAEYARLHGTQYGRIQLIRIIDGVIKRLELNDLDIRQRVLRCVRLDELSSLFSTHAI